MIPRLQNIPDMEELIKQINRRLELIDREFATKREIKIKLKEIKSFDNRPSREQEENELRIRDDAGTKQLAIKIDGRLYTGDLIKEIV